MFSYLALLVFSPLHNRVRVSFKDDCTFCDHPHQGQFSLYVTCCRLRSNYTNAPQSYNSCRELRQKRRHVRQVIS